MKEEVVFTTTMYENGHCDNHLTLKLARSLRGLTSAIITISDLRCEARYQVWFRPGKARNPNASFTTNRLNQLLAQPTTTALNGGPLAAHYGKDVNVDYSMEVAVERAQWDAFEVGVKGHSSVALTAMVKAEVKGRFLCQGGVMAFEDPNEALLMKMKYGTTG